MDFGTRLKLLRHKKNMTQQELANILGVGRPTIAGYETKNKQPDFAKLVHMAEVFEVTMDYLLGLTDQPTAITKGARIPILGIIRAGLPVIAQENWDDVTELPFGLTADFALRVKGDSMSWVGIHEGDLAFMRQCDTASHGMIVAVGIENMEWEATLKYFIQESGELLLRAANPAYKDIKVTNKHRIIGQLIKVVKEPPSFYTYKNFLTQKELVENGWTKAFEKGTQLGINGKEVEKIIEVLSIIKNGTLNG